MCRQTLTLCALVGMVTWTSAARAQPLSDDEVFAQVFAPRAQRARLPVMLVIGGQRVGSLIAERTNGIVHVTAAPVLDALADAKLQPRVRVTLAKAARSGRLSTADLRNAGLEAELDEQRLELRITIPPALTEATSHTLGMDGVPAEAATAIRPSDRSGYVNLIGRTATDAASQLHLEGAFSLHRWVLEARADVIEEIGAQRGDVLLSHDVRRSALRLLAGDFAVAGAGMQSSFPVLGIGVTRNFTIQPYRRIQPVGVFHFTLDAPSTVTVLVNGAVVQSLQLEAGRHDVRNLPGAGVSDVELVIRDSSGHERRLEFSSVSPGDLLAPGVVQFSLSLGFPLLDTAGMRDYAWYRPVVSGRRRWGVTPRMTLGISGDADVARQVGGASATFASTLGNISLDAHASHDELLATGAAGAVRYDHARATDSKSTTTFMLALRAYTSGYRSLAVLDVDGAYRGDATVTAARKLVGDIFGRVNLRYQVGPSSAEAYDASVALSRSFGGLTVDATVGVRDTHLERRDTRLFVSASWVLPGRRGFAQAMSRMTQHAGHSNELRATSSARPGGGLVASAAVREDSHSLDGSSALTYTDARFTASLTGGTTTDRALGEPRTRASAEVGTAVAFAGGRVAWSRPINGSFAIVDRHDAIATTAVAINPVAGHAASRADRFGAGVVMGFEPYRVGSLRVEAPALDVGRSLGATTRWILPGYKTGTLVVVGEAGSVYLRGTLRHADRTAASHVVGELVRDVRGTHPQTSEPSELWVVMSNAAGRFSVVGVSPGRYVLTIPDAPPIGVIIPQGSTGVYSIGDIAID